MEPVVVKASQAATWSEGAEVCRLFHKTDKITFGSSALMPGETGGTDPGHAKSHEVFYCARGHVRVELNDGIIADLCEGDALLIPPAVPHTITNVGSEPCIVTWSLAPSE